MKKRSWIIEVLTYFVFTFLMNVIITLIYANGICILLGQILIVSGYSFILTYTLIRLNKAKDGLAIGIKGLFTVGFSWKEIPLMVLIFLGGALSYAIISEVEWINNVNLNPHPHPEVRLSQNVLMSNKIVFIPLVLLQVLIGVFAEELFFRGYLFQKQVKTFKRNTWIVNGLTWSLMHIFTPTNFIALIPMGLLLAFAFQKKWNIRIPLGAHLIMNSVVAYKEIIEYFAM